MLLLSYGCLLSLIFLAGELLSVRQRPTRCTWRLHNGHQRAPHRGAARVAAMVAWAEASSENQVAANARGVRGLVREPGAVRRRHLAWQTRGLAVGQFAASLERQP